MAMIWYRGDFPLPGLADVMSYPALRRPVRAARVVCGNQPRFLLIVATSAPSFRPSKAMSLAFFVTARGADAGFGFCSDRGFAGVVGSDFVDGLVMFISVLILQTRFGFCY